MRCPSFVLLGVPACLAVVAGCSSGSSSQSTTPGQDLAPGQRLEAGQVALSLVDGTTATIDPGSAPTPAKDALTLVRVSGGSASLCRADEVDEQGLHENRAAVSIDTFYLAAFELTQGQWQTLVSATQTTVSAVPWREVVPAGQFGAAIGDAYPVYGISYDAAQRVIAAWNAKQLSNIRLRLPSSVEWEYACIGGALGAAAPFAWGDSQEQQVVARHARVRETAGTDLGPAAAGSLAANALGLFDMHGNVWEWVSNGGAGGAPVLRGGSWGDNLLSAASGNRFLVHRTVPFGSAGLRLVAYIP